jgi:putative transposase
LEEARRKYRFELWAYVIMPEHVHLLIYPRLSEADSTTANGRKHATTMLPTPFKNSGRATPSARGNARAKSECRHPESPMGDILKAIKEPVARQAVKYLESNAPSWLARITVQEGSRVRRRFWQPGGGYDRNLVEPPTAYHMIDYFHANPVRRGLVERPEDWEWSSARWYAGIRPVVIEIDTPQLGMVADL